MDLSRGCYVCVLSFTIRSLWIQVAAGKRLYARNLFQVSIYLVNGTPEVVDFGNQSLRLAAFIATFSQCWLTRVGNASTRVKSSWVKGYGAKRPGEGSKSL